MGGNTILWTSLLAGSSPSNKACSYNNIDVCETQIPSSYAWDEIGQTNQQMACHSGAWVFSGSRINGLRIDGSRGFAISRLYNTYRQFLLIIMNISMCMCLSVLYLWYTTTYKYISRHELDRYSLQHFRHGSPMQSWLMSSSPPLQDENLY